MNTAKQECIWKEQCGSECRGRCQDYSPIDETEMDKEFYFRILKENAEEYQKVIDDYSDGNVVADEL